MQDRLLFRPISDPDRQIDVTDGLVSALAYQLWRHFGENAEINWLEAEILVRRFLGEVDCGAGGHAAGLAHPLTEQRMRNHPATVELEGRKNGTGARRTVSSKPERTHATRPSDASWVSDAPTLSGRSDMRVSCRIGIVPVPQSRVRADRPSD